MTRLTLSHLNENIMKYHNDELIFIYGADIKFDMYNTR